MFNKLAGQTYVDKFTEGINYLNKFIQSQTAAFKAWALTVIAGGSQGSSWSPNLQDGNLKNMQKCLDVLNSMKKEYSSVFTKAVLDACNDETLTLANEKFIELSTSSNMISQTKAISYLNEIIGGSTAKMTSDANKAIAAMKDYTAIVNKMQ